MSAEQMVRDLLTEALREGLVKCNHRDWVDPDPQCRSSGELVGTANLLASFLGETVQKRDERWQMAVGNSLEGVEGLARAETDQRRDG